MKAAFSSWEDRIAPVFDTATWLRIVEVESGKIVRETKESLPDGGWIQTALCLAELRVDVLVCGAISGPLHALIEAYGIEVIPFVAGDLQKVIQAWIASDLDRSLFAMPGCGLRRRHRHRRGAQNRNHPRWGTVGTEQRGMKSGRGRGRGRGGRGFGHPK
jgi:predicted Fe-Mo cluster-binding NifX family protein